MIIVTVRRINEDTPLAEVRLLERTSTSIRVNSDDTVTIALTSDDGKNTPMVHIPTK